MIRDDEPFARVIPIAFNSRGAVPDETIWDQMLSKRLDLCRNECESNRVMCILRPKCEDRRYLDVLLLDDNFRNKLPEFCYSVRVDHLIKAESNDKVPHDIHIFVEDLATVLLRKKQKRRPFSTNLLQKILKKVKKSFFVKDGNLILIEANDLFYLINVAQGLVLVKPEETLITTEELFQLIVRFYSEKNDCSFKIKLNGRFIEVTIQASSDTSPFRKLEDLPAEVLDYLVAANDKERTLEFELPQSLGWIFPPTRNAAADQGQVYLTFKKLITVLASLFW